MDSFSKKLINIDSKLEILDRKTNSTQILISSLNSEILKLTTMFHPLTDNVEAINTSMDNLKNDLENYLALASCIYNNLALSNRKCFNNNIYMNYS